MSTSNETMFSHYERSLINGRNLRTASQQYAVRQAAKALASVRANPTHSYAEASDALLVLADARLALYRAENGHDLTYDERCAMYEVAK